MLLTVQHTALLQNIKRIFILCKEPVTQIAFLADRFTDGIYRIIILHVDFYVCETWSLILGGKQAEVC